MCVEIVFLHVDDAEPPRAPMEPQQAPKSPQDAPKMPPRGHYLVLHCSFPEFFKQTYILTKMPLRRPQVPPKAPLDAPKTPQDAQKRPQDAP